MTIKTSFALMACAMILSSCGSSSLRPTIPNTDEHEFIGGYEWERDEYLTALYVIRTSVKDACDDEKHFDSINWSKEMSLEKAELTILYLSEDQLEQKEFSHLQERGVVVKEDADDVPLFNEIGNANYNGMYFKLIAQPDFTASGRGEFYCIDTKY